MTPQRRVGAHLSTTGGIQQTVITAHERGANALQVFSGSPRMWRRTPLEKIDAEKIYANQKKYNVTPIFTHALYLVNLASDNPELLQKSVEALKHDLRFDAHIGGAGVVVHLGSHQGRGFDAVKQTLVAKIHEVLEATPENSRFLIENSAGQNGKIASDPREIRWLLDEVRSPRLGWCFDTCHGFAAGLTLAALAGGSAGEKGEKSVIDTFEELNLLESLTCIHLNDSKDPFGSGRDRHENIGDGSISSGVLRAFLTDPRLLPSIPLITEAPGLDGNGPDAENIRRIWELVGEKKA